jgi:hypothetical protein
MPIFQPVQSQPLVDIGTPSGQGLVQQSKQHIEAQYIDKAKKIIATTTGDPYVRTKELSKTKVEFLARKYGKKLKILDE